jgi:hypothetical protein
LPKSGNDHDHKDVQKVLSVMIPARKLRTGETGMPDPWSALAGPLAGTRLEVVPAGCAFPVSIALPDPGIKFSAVSDS